MTEENQAVEGLTAKELRQRADEHDRVIWYHCIDMGVPMERCLMWPDRDPCCGMVSAVTGEWLGICPPPRLREPRVKDGAHGPVHPEAG